MCFTSTAMLCLSTTVAFATVLASMSVDGAEVLQFRLPETSTLHVKDEKTVREYEQRLLTLGCEAKVSKHFFHFDLIYQCPEWRSASFATRAEMSPWATFLAAMGFETSYRQSNETGGLTDER